ncbi:NACHT domain-containing protein, partial [Planosporangium mesophilum]|nr:NACHT domain-containing protein [Planosporangium mesophilum]
MSNRLALVVASQWGAGPNRLDFLPELAGELAKVLTDPRLGDCDSALASGALLIDLTRPETVAAVKEAFKKANDAGATLVLALLGHGIAFDEDFYFLPYDGTAQGDSDEDVHLPQLLKEQLRAAANLDGLLVLLDTCYAGIGAEGAAAWREVGLGECRRRYEMLTASGDQPAFGGKFSRALIEVLRSGVPAAGSTVDSRYARAKLQQRLGSQHPKRVTHDGGGYEVPGDEGLWLAHNAAHDVTMGGADARGVVRDRVAELTAHLQPLGVLDKLVAAATTTTWVALVGPRGSGKSTLAAALARPTSTRGKVPDRFVQAIAFATRTSTMADLAGTLAAQMAVTVTGFGGASNRYLHRLTSEEQQGLDAMQRHVIGPLTLLDPVPVTRLVVDAVDDLPQTTHHTLLNTLDALGGRLHVVVTARPDSLLPGGSRLIPTGRASDDIITEYLRSRGVAEEYRAALLRQARGSWLHAQLLADRAVRRGFDPATLADDVRPSLTKLYDDELLAASRYDTAVWQSSLRPVLGLLAVAGVGPVLPLSLLVAASGHLHGPATTTQVRDVLVAVSGLVVRAQPGQPTEHVGLFHDSLAEDYLLRSNGGQFLIEPADYHAALATAINDLAPLQEHDLSDPLHRYALHAEARHRWYACHDSGAVIESLAQRSAGSATDEQEKWQPWPDILATLGNEHPDALEARAHVAEWTGRAGNPAAARDQYAALVSALERLPKSRDPDILIEARASLAAWTGRAGNAAAARDQYTDLLPIRTKVSGADNPRTLTVRHNIAHWTGVAGSPTAARDQYTDLLPIRTKVSGAENADTLAVRHNLAHWTGEAGDPTAARDQFVELLDLQREAMGWENPQTLLTRAKLAGWTGKAGDAAAARGQYKALLPLTERKFG